MNPQRCFGGWTHLGQWVLRMTLTADIIRISNIEQGISNVEVRVRYALL